MVLPVGVLSRLFDGISVNAVHRAPVPRTPVAVANNLAPVVNGFHAQGLSQIKMIDALNRLNIPATRGGQWGHGSNCSACSRVSTPPRKMQSPTTLQSRAPDSWIPCCLAQH